jgi:hypothetical protein
VLRKPDILTCYRHSPVWACSSTHNPETQDRLAKGKDTLISERGLRFNAGNYLLSHTGHSCPRPLTLRLPLIRSVTGEDKSNTKTKIKFNRSGQEYPLHTNKAPKRKR